MINFCRCCNLCLEVESAYCLNYEEVVPFSKHFCWLWEIDAKQVDFQCNFGRFRPVRSGSIYCSSSCIKWPINPYRSDNRLSLQRKKWLKKTYFIPNSWSFYFDKYFENLLIYIPFLSDCRPKKISSFSFKQLSLNFLKK